MTYSQQNGCKTNDKNDVIEVIFIRRLIDSEGKMKLYVEWV